MSPGRNGAAKPARRARGSLNEDEIINAAIELVERDGLAGLSMPKLARHLNAGVMSLYWYFRSKDDLLVALADRAYLDVYSRLPPVGEGPWGEEAEASARALLRQLRGVALYLPLCRSRRRSLVHRPSVIPVLARRLEAELRLFSREGLTASEAHRFLTVRDVFTRGFALMQVDSTEASEAGADKQALAASVAQLKPDKFPTLRAVSDVGEVISVADEGFEVVLRLLVAGMEAEAGERGLALGEGPKAP